MERPSKFMLATTVLNSNADSHNDFSAALDPHPTHVGADRLSHVFGSRVFVKILYGPQAAICPESLKIAAGIPWAGEELVLTSCTEGLEADGLVARESNDGASERSFSPPPFRKARKRRTEFGLNAQHGQDRLFTSPTLDFGPAPPLDESFPRADPGRAVTP